LSTVAFAGTLNAFGALTLTATFRSAGNTLNLTVNGASGSAVLWLDQPSLNSKP
jgi:hypothetical protein